MLLEDKYMFYSIYFLVWPPTSYCQARGCMFSYSTFFIYSVGRLVSDATQGENWWYFDYAKCKQTHKWHGTDSPSENQ